MSTIFGDVRQIGYATRDIMSSMTFMATSCGIGPWFLAEAVVMEGQDEHDRPVRLELSIALANSGTVQYELIQPHVDGPSLYTPALDRTSDEMTVHHYSSWSDDFDGVAKRAAAAGFAAIVRGRTGYGPFVYYRHPARPTFLVETAALSPQRRSVFDQVAAAARGWSGQQPIRIGWPQADPA